MCKSIKEELTKFAHKHGVESKKMEHFAIFLDEFFNTKVKGCADDLYDAFVEELDVVLNELTEEDLECMLSEIHRKDGHIGCKFKREEACLLAKQYDIESRICAMGHEYDASHWWVMINYVYATHFATNKSIAAYIELTIDELVDKNICTKTKICMMYKKYNERKVII